MIDLGTLVRLACVLDGEAGKGERGLERGELLGRGLGHVHPEEDVGVGGELTDPLEGQGGERLAALA